MAHPPCGTGDSRGRKRQVPRLDGATTPLEAHLGDGMASPRTPELPTAGEEGARGVAPRQDPQLVNREGQKQHNPGPANELEWTRLVGEILGGPGPGTA
jgi:hypothetical protein